MSNVREKWEYYGKKDPYFAVSTFEKFRGDAIDSSREDFFASGEAHVERVWHEIETHFESGFTPENAIDFGCGVGRLVVPLAQRCGHVVGVDISETMLAEARRNCESRSIDNVRFLQTDDFLASDAGKFDLVHSVIVFQHIEPSLGMSIVRRLVDSLLEGGIGVLHFTYASRDSEIGTKAFRLYRDVPVIYKLRNLILGKPDEPLIPMYPYDLNAIFRLLQDNGCHKAQVRFTHHGLRGAIIFFQKHTDPLF